MKKFLVIAMIMTVVVCVPHVASAASTRSQIFAPEGAIQNVLILHDGSVEVTYDLTDQSGSLLNTDTYQPEIQMYDGKTLVESHAATVGEDQTLVFSNLEKDKEYTFLLSAPYDLIGLSVPTNTAPYEIARDTATVHSVKSKPGATIHLTTDEKPSVVNDEEGTIDLHYDLVDGESALINEGTAGPRIVIQNLKDGSLAYSGSLIVGQDNVEHVFGLENGETYRITILGQYDRNYDGKTDNASPYTLDSKLFSL